MSKNLQSHNESIVRLRIIIILGARKRLKCWVVLEASSYFARWREWRCGRRSTTIPQQWSSQVGKQTFCKESFWIELISNNLFWFAQRTKRKKAPSPMHLNARLFLKILYVFDYLLPSTIVSIQLDASVLNWSVNQLHSSIPSGLEELLLEQVF